MMSQVKYLPKAITLAPTPELTAWQRRSKVEYTTMANENGPQPDDVTARQNAKWERGTREVKHLPPSDGWRTARTCVSNDPLLSFSLIRTHSDFIKTAQFASGLKVTPPNGALT